MLQHVPRPAEQDGELHRDEHGEQQHRAGRTARPTPAGRPGAPSAPSIPDRSGGRGAQVGGAAEHAAWPPRRRRSTGPTVPPSMSGTRLGQHLGERRVGGGEQGAEDHQQGHRDGHGRGDPGAVGLARRRAADRGRDHATARAAPGIRRPPTSSRRSPSRGSTGRRPPRARRSAARWPGRAANSQPADRTVPTPSRATVAAAQPNRAGSSRGAARVSRGHGTLVGRGRCGISRATSQRRGAGQPR